jgi:NTE family protein
MNNNNCIFRGLCCSLVSLLLSSILFIGTIETSAAQNKTTPSTTPTIGIALGAGGANGLAHILMLEVLDDLHIKPHRITGSSIGAVIGALYASGMSARDIRALVEEFIISSDEKLFDELLNPDAMRWMNFIEVELGKGGLLSTEGFVKFLHKQLGDIKFEQLQIPLQIVASDLWERKQVVLQSGPVIPAINASMALPGVFDPVIIDDHVLVDGGLTNPVPFDLLLDECDIVIAIDVSGVRTRPDKNTPTFFETIFNSIKVMQSGILNAKMQYRQPDIYLAPEIVDVRTLEFYRAKQIFSQAQPAKKELRKRLEQILAK